MSLPEFALYLVINGKVISLHKVTKYLKRSKGSFDDFREKHAVLAFIILYIEIVSIDFFRKSIFNKAFVSL